MWLIVGLGNPGAMYEKNRHNFGFMAVDALATMLKASHFQQNFSALGSKASLENNPVYLLKPQSFMNRSGQSVQQAAHFYKIDPAHIIVIHDELDIPFGTVRVKLGGGPGGHNGVRDVIAHMGNDFVRVRAGVGRPAIKGSEANFVLDNYSAHEQRELAHQIQHACDAVKAIIVSGIEKAQRTTNQKLPLAKT